MGFASLVAIVSLVIAQTSADIADSSQRPCALDGTEHQHGTYTPRDRCIQYKCNDGVWEYHNVNPECGECQSSSKRTEDTSIKTYDSHSIGGLIKHSYQFKGNAGVYPLVQVGLQTPSQVSVNVTFSYTEENESRIKTVLYTESGTTVELQIHSVGDSKILVNGSVIKNPTSLYGAMTPFSSKDGIIYVNHDSPIWPIVSGGNIHIVGSQGLAVSIWTYDGYAWFVTAYAMPSMKTKLYGLCDVYTTIKGVITDPVDYTKQDGTTTTNIHEFIKSWEVDSITNDRSADQELTDQGTDPSGICGFGECSIGGCVPDNNEAIGVQLPNCFCPLGTYCWTA